MRAAPASVSVSGVIALTETLYNELAPDGVGVSVLCPGSVDTAVCRSERNRPEVLGVEQRTSTGEAMRVGVEQGLRGADGKSPAEVADVVLDAIRTDRFWIITHPEWVTVMEDRVVGMRSGKLVQGFGG